MVVLCAARRVRNTADTDAEEEGLGILTAECFLERVVFYDLPLMHRAVLRHSQYEAGFGEFAKSLQGTLSSSRLLREL